MVDTDPQATLLLERLIEPSRIRRGRMATSPTWYVKHTVTGARWRFPTKRDAQRFIVNGGCARAPHPRWRCPDCQGSVVEPGMTPFEPPP